MVTDFPLLVATKTFPGIIQKKKNANRKISWEIGDLELKEGTELLSKISHGFYLLVGTLSSVISLLFFQLLLLEVSYDCDPNEKSKDCFEFKPWGSLGFSDAPINCTSKAVIDGSVETVCYEIVNNFGIAAGASYGVFQISNGALDLLATLILMRNTTTFVSKVQIVVVLALVGISAVLIAVQSTSWRVYLGPSNFVYIYQALGIFLLAYEFIFLLPWKDIIKKINEERSTGEPELGYISLGQGKPVRRPIDTESTTV